MGTFICNHCEDEVVINGQGRNDYIYWCVRCLNKDIRVLNAAIGYNYSIDLTTDPDYYYCWCYNHVSFDCIKAIPKRYRNKIKRLMCLKK